VISHGSLLFGFAACRKFIESYLQRSAVVAQQRSGQGVPSGVANPAGATNVNGTGKPPASGQASPNGAIKPPPGSGRS
jgi:hypothetical protein